MEGLENEVPVDGNRCPDDSQFLNCSCRGNQLAEGDGDS